MKRAGVYVRISSDPDGTALGVERQKTDCQELASAKGWRIAGVYEDNDVSATRGKPRPGYQRLLADIRAGKVDAVVVWDLDRLHRRPVELEEFLDLAKTHSLSLASVGGDVDLGTEQGVLIAGIKAQVGRYEAQQISRRVRRKQEELRAAGKPFSGGLRPYGYDKSRSRVVPEEAAVIREVAERLIGGASLGSIAADLNARGILPARAALWSVTTLKAVISKPRIAGLLTYRGDVQGEAAWPAILDVDTFRRLQVAMDRRRPANSMSNARKYLLSGIALCGADGCGKPMQVAYHPRGVLGYKCVSGHVGRNMKHLDEYLRQEVTAFAAEHPVRVSEWQSPEGADIAARLEALERRKIDAANQFADGSLPADMLRVIGNSLQTQIDALQQEQDDSAAVDFDLARWVAFDFSNCWDGLPLVEKRTAIAMYVTRLVVNPAKRKGAGFDPASIDITFRDPDRMAFRAVVES